MNFGELRVMPVGIGEEQGGVAIKQGAAGSVVARRGGVPDQRRPLSRDGVPAEMVSELAMKRAVCIWVADVACDIDCSFNEQ